MNKKIKSGKNCLILFVTMFFIGGWIPLKAYAFGYTNVNDGNPPPSSQEVEAEPTQTKPQTKEEIREYRQQRFQNNISNKKHKVKWSLVKKKQHSVTVENATTIDIPATKAGAAVQPETPAEISTTVSNANESCPDQLQDALAHINNLERNLNIKNPVTRPSVIAKSGETIEQQVEPATTVGIQVGIRNTNENCPDQLQNALAKINNLKNLARNLRIKRQRDAGRRVGISASRGNR